MKADDHLDALAGAISDGNPVDWDLAESGTRDDDALVDVRTLREVERIADIHRILLRSPLPAGAQTLADPAGGGAKHATSGPVRWGDLTLLELVRTGAYGEVWRAWDAWLERDVALKFLLTVGGTSSEGVHDSALLAEARALARVRHPGVVAVHGIAEHDGRVGMWMEFLEGTTLAAEIERRGILSPREVARIGLELCRALEAVESAGVVHRDIKPANVILESTGRVVLTDFGLGRRWELAAASLGASGTPVFMSPGILSGEPATPRSDIYALGVTLRWALTGHPPFRAQTLEELRVEAQAGPSTPLAVERPDVPPALIAAIDRAMTPDPEARYAGAAQMAAALELVLDGPKAGAARQWRTSLRVAFVAAAVVALGAIAILLPRFVEWQARSPVTRFTVAPPPHTTLAPEPTHSAISPDGRLLAMVATDSAGVDRLWLRPLRSPEAQPIEGTEGAMAPFWSPDSRNLGFFSMGKLKKVSVAGGPPEVLCDAHDMRGGSWGKSGVIIFAPEAAGPLYCISAEGGPVRQVLRPDSTRQETALRWPEFLPDGRHFLFVSLPPRDGNFDVYVSSIDSGTRKRILRSAAAPVCAGNDGLILASDGRLMAQRFDSERMELIGQPRSLGPATAFDLSVGERPVSVSSNGVLIQPTAALENTRLVWLDRSGKSGAALAIPEGRYEKMLISPDGSQLLAVRRTSPVAVDLWVIDLAKGPPTRLTARSQSRIGGDLAWSPDGSRVAFSSNRDGPTNIYVKQVSQVADEELIYQSSSQFKEVDAWSPDGQFLLFEQADPISSWDLWLLPMRGERKPIPYLRSNFSEIGGTISPDGRWAAYASDESGRAEIYVQSFPTPGAKYRISSEGALRAAWSKDGRELVFVGLDGTIWSVPVTTTPIFKAGTPHRLFRSRSDALWFAATPDLHRFLESVPEPDVAPSSISVVLNWPAELGK
jgi:Tol biopolymer transport system component